MTIDFYRWDNIRAHLSPGRAIEVEARKGRGPLGEQPYQPAIVDVVRDLAIEEVYPTPRSSSAACNISPGSLKMSGPDTRTSSVAVALELPAGGAVEDHPAGDQICSI